VVSKIAKKRRSVDLMIRQEEAPRNQTACGEVDRKIGSSGSESNAKLGTGLLSGNLGSRPGTLFCTDSARPFNAAVTARSRSDLRVNETVVFCCKHAPSRRT